MNIEVTFNLLKSIINLLRLFNTNNPVVLFLLFIFGALLRLPYFLHPEQLTVVADNNVLGGLFYTKWFEPLSKSPIALLINSYLITFILAIYFNIFLNKQRLLTVQNYYPALAILITSALVPQWCVPSIPAVVSFLMLLIVQRLITLYRKEKMYSAVFDVGMIAGIAVLLYASLIWMGLFFLFTFFILRAFVIREWLNVYVGMFVPLFLVATAYIYYDHWGSFVNGLLFNSAFHKNIQFSLSTASIVVYCWIVLLCLLLFVKLQSTPIGRLVLVRKVFWVWFHYTWIMIVSYFFTPDRSPTHFYLLILPFSFYLSYYLCIEKNKWIREGVFLVFLAVLVYHFLTVL